LRERRAMNLPNLVPPLRPPGPPRRPPGLLSDINWRGIAVLVLLAILFFVLWTVIRELAGVGGGFGAVVMGWFRDASINPEDRAGFTSFLRLLLIAGFIAVLILILGRK